MSELNLACGSSKNSPLAWSPRYMAPELINPAGFGLDRNNPTKKSDIYAFGVVTYQVGVTLCISYGN